MTKDEALKQALEALEGIHPGNMTPMAEEYWNKAITAIKEALAQPEEEPLHPVHIGVDVTKEGTAVTAFYRKPNAVMEMFYAQFHPLAQPAPVQEPVAWMNKHGACKTYLFREVEAGAKEEYTVPVYTIPPRRTWVGLTDEEREQVINANTATGLWHMAKDIEAKLRSKNEH
jgi:hypothetical protein